MFNYMLLFIYILYIYMYILYIISFDNLNFLNKFNNYLEWKTYVTVHRRYPIPIE
jgi:hypothetical protein